MANKTLKTRIQNKHDTEANWNNATNFIPLNGELIIYDEDTTYSYKRLKIGDGSTNVISLPFFNNDLETRLKAIEDALGQEGYTIPLVKNEAKTTVLNFIGTTGSIGISDGTKTYYQTGTLTQTVTDSEGTVTKIVSATAKAGSFASGPTIDGTSVKCILYGNTANSNALGSVTVVYEIA